MANKLYIEEQVKEIVEKSRETGLTAEYLILTTPPIELPSDEEIEKKADEYVENKWEYIWKDIAQDECKEAFTDGAKWLRHKILNQNK